MMRSKILRLAILVAALLLLGALIARLGPAEIAGQLVRAGPGVVWMIAIYLLGTAIGAVPWYLLLPPGVRPRLVGAVAGRVAASGANAILPLLGIGGEPVRLLWLSSEARTAGVAAIIVDRLVYAAASAMFLVAGVVAVIETTDFPTTYVIAAALAATALVLLTAIGVWVAARHRMAGRIHRWIRRLRKRAVPSPQGFGEQVDEHVQRILVGRHRAPWLSLLLHLLGRVVLGAEVYVGFQLLDVALSPSEALIFASVPVLLAFVGAVVPSQIGVQEGAQTLVAVALGVPSSAAISVVLLQRIRQLVSVSLAWILIAAMRHPERGAPLTSTSPAP